MRTNRFSIPRATVARMGVEEYIVSFWWMAVPIPLFGVLALLFGSGAVQTIGLLAVLWPFTLFVRAWFATSKAGRLYEKGVEVEWDDENAYFCPEANRGVRLRFESVRQVARRHGYLVLRLRRTGFLLVSEAAFANPFEAEDFLSRFRGLSSVPAPP
ncbi:MAG TPA: hypothetical protein VGE01_08150 [Fimbriimonas sp.]